MCRFIAKLYIIYSMNSCHFIASRKQIRFESVTTGTLSEFSHNLFLSIIIFISVARPKQQSTQTEFKCPLIWFYDVTWFKLLIFRNFAKISSSQKYFNVLLDGTCLSSLGHLHHRIIVVSFPAIKSNELWLNH